VTSLTGDEPHANALAALAERVSATSATQSLVRVGGTVTQVTPASCCVSGLSAFVRLGDRVSLDTHSEPQLGEVIRLDETRVTIKTFQEPIAAGLGARAWRTGAAVLNPDPSWKGHVFDALGRPVDEGASLLHGPEPVYPDRGPPAALRRQRLGTPFKTGVRVIDLFTPLCFGQRIGIFSGSGIGKSTLLAMLSRASGFDTVVIALVGERGREVREFLEDALGNKRERVVAVVSTGDESPMMRRLAPKTATCIAEYFRDRGENVLLIVDSITRFAHAARDVALAAGEPPVARGYTPSVFSNLPGLLERAGPGEEGSGSITGIYSVLVDGDDHNDPVADCIRGTLDGHIVLDRAIADQARYPAVNVLSSVSRLATYAWTPEQRNLVSKLRAMIARYEDTRDLRLMGGYRTGADAELDKAVEIVPKIFEAIKQSPHDSASADAFQEVARALSGG
jgi:flagellum-specific ATP synthase